MRSLAKVASLALFLIFPDVRGQLETGLLPDPRVRKLCSYTAAVLSVTSLRWYCLADLISLVAKGPSENSSGPLFVQRDDFVVMPCLEAMAASYRSVFLPFQISKHQRTCRGCVIVLASAAPTVLQRNSYCTLHVRLTSNCGYYLPIFYPDYIVPRLHLRS